MEEEKKSIFEIIVEVLRKANIGFSFNEIKEADLLTGEQEQKPEGDQNELGKNT